MADVVKEEEWTCKDCPSKAEGVCKGRPDWWECDALLGRAEAGE